jgi:hypothetical protein
MVLALLIHLRESCTVQMPTSKEEKAITAAAKLDPDAQPLTAKQLKAMVPIRALPVNPTQFYESQGFKQIVGMSKRRFPSAKLVSSPAD